MIRHFITSWYLNVWKVKTWLSQEKKSFDNIADTTFKACVRYFSFFSPNDSHWLITENAFLFHLKRSFHLHDIQIFVFQSSPLFFPVSHWYRWWWKIYDVSNCLNKNLITHSVWYLEREKRCNTELCQLIGY